MDTVFDEHRRLLLGLSYRLLGSMWDAEDVVQEAFLRWMNTDRSQIREPRSFLVTVVTRLALDQLRSARVTREAYTGPWLPEPVDEHAFGPLETAELRDTLSYATLHLMERLSPPERAVFVLREAFKLPYDEIAEILDHSAATCRQWYRRAAKYVARDAKPFAPHPSDHAELLTRFLAAARDGDMTALTDMLAEDVAAYNDGGGRVRAALRPIVGRDHVLAFVAGLTSRYPLQKAHLTRANGEPAIWTVIGRQQQLVTFDVREGRIHAIYGVLNPEKLTRILTDEYADDR
ncbi:RNA polymerase sigma-70 factor [Actinoallomurus iriomotensis]|uniref:DNA-directed RNA polymerase sigma-70 factor n=1 Tax=Actinoallomurus iriomotensis TaxID=478107 RepID=A0A9W6W2B4_9ACTN|nr:RNA polymerase sigma-70 factor [Actinoallomurus iriomotensis]GLY88775.1 DNA-directed RNA polymerase sigma-70 factor [Actinoallomurus iriomotensis]